MQLKDTCRGGSVLVLAILLAACSSTANLGSGGSQVFESGAASYYGERYNGRPTASGALFDMSAMTAAHRTLPFGTMVRVTNVTNGRSVDVEINDRGPFARGRVIDLSQAAFASIATLEAGLVEVTLEVLDP